MTDIYIDFPTYVLGSQDTTIEDSNAQGRLFSPVDQLRDAGFGRHHICRKGEDSYHLAHKLVTNMRTQLEGSETPLENMSAIIYATCLSLNGNIGDVGEYEKTGDIKHLLDYPVSHLQADFDISEAFAIGINQQACTSMLGGIRLAHNFLVAEEDLESILCLTADRFPEGAKYEQSYNLISDGAAGVVVSKKKGGYRYLTCQQITNGAMAQASDDETVGHYFSYSRELILKSLNKAGLNIQDIQHIVPQNTNKVAWQILSSVIGIPLEKVFLETVGEVGHVISGDNIINLRHLEIENKVQSGDKLLLLMAGFGLNWQCLILEKV